LLSACAGRPATTVDSAPSAVPNRAAAPSPTVAQLAEQTASPSPGPTETPSQLYAILGGEPVPIENGESVQLTDALGVQITIDPYPPIGLSAQPVLDLYLSNPVGQPVRGAAIEITYDMLSMAHGPFQPPTIEQEGGHYLTSLDLLMFGPWGMEIEILEPNDAPAVRLRIVVVVALPEE
jgi:hypothetical protein